jgi:uncharacterized membrane protein YhfC
MDQNNLVLVIMFIIAGTFNVIFPFVLGWWIIRKKYTSWRLFAVGVLTFIGSQVFHIPLVNGLTKAFASGALPHVSPGFAPFFNAIVLGLLAGIFEETARWIGYKVLKKKGDSFGAALTLGAGHGGIEAVSIGFIVLINLVAMLGLRSMDTANLPLPAEQMQKVLEGMQTYFATPWHLPLAGAVERIGAMGLHITLSVMVWLAISFRKPLWFWGAILYHALIDGLVVLATSFNLGTWLIEFVFVVVSFAVLYFVLRFAKQKDQQRVVLLDVTPPEGNFE